MKLFYSGLLLTKKLTRRALTELLSKIALLSVLKKLINQAAGCTPRTQSQLKFHLVWFLIAFAAVDSREFELVLYVDAAVGAVVF